MRFPNTEAKIIALAQKIIAGLRDNPNFPNPTHFTGSTPGQSGQGTQFK